MTQSEFEELFPDAQQAEFKVPSEVLKDTFFSTTNVRYEYVAQIRLVQPDLFKESVSTVETYRALHNNRMMQVHDKTGLFRVRLAPTEQERFPQYGRWQEAGALAKTLAGEE